MRRYYWAAKAVTQLNQILMLNIEERVAGAAGRADAADLENFLERGGMLEVASDDLYERDPHAILETFLALPDRRVGPKGLSARTLRALYNARHLMDAKFRRDPVNHATFMEILKASRRPDARLSADEPDQRARPLPLGLSPHRRPDAARPVPRLHGRPAHPDGAAQRAPLPHSRARPRVPVLLAARLDLRASPGCSTSPPSSTTSPRAAAATIPSSARARSRRFCRDHGVSRRRRDADRVARRRAPDDDRASPRRKTSPTPT